MILDCQLEGLALANLPEQVLADLVFVPDGLDSAVVGDGGDLLVEQTDSCRQ
jgi:hypothetical protein